MSVSASQRVRPPKSQRYISSASTASTLPSSPPRDDGLSDEAASDSELFDDTVRALRHVNTFSKDFGPDEERAVVKKLDRNLVLFLALLYLLSFLDRSNIGNARLAGLESSLAMSDRDFDYCLIAFYITYILFEWMIVLYRLVPPRIYISLCVLTWGLVASLQSVVTGFGQLIALRAALGITESAFGPGVPFYMTFFYNRSELAYRVGLQISAAPLATSFASSLAWVITKLAQKTSLDPWRALFLVEGFPSVVAALAAYYIVPNSPETAPFLTPRERRVAQLRLKKEQAHDPGVYQTRRKDWWSKIASSPTLRTLLSPIPWLQALIFFSINVAFASLPVFLPTIINSMSFSALTSQALSAPPYLIAFVFVLVIGHFSDSIANSRGWCLMACAGMSAMSYFLIAFIGFLDRRNQVPAAISITVRYAAVYGAAMGLFASVVLIITWNLNNQPSRKEKGLAMVVMNVVGQCGPLIGVQLFPKSDEPFYINGMITSGLFMSLVVVLSGILRWYLQTLNQEDRRAVDDKSYEMVGLRGVQTEGDGSIEGHDLSIRRTEYSGFEYML